MKTELTQAEEAFREGLQQHIPEEALNYTIGLLRNKGVRVVAARDRKTKFGDFRPGTPYQPHRISVNASLPGPLFLFTFLHEIAHLAVWEHYGRVKPHGKEWQQQFREYAEHCIALGAFPESLAEPVRRHVRKGYASTGSDPAPSRHFLQYSGRKGVMIDDLPEGETFLTPDGKTFRKIAKLRKRIKCLCLNNKKHYLFQPNTIIEQQQK
ncbi:MAG: SprT-like domain-containing protein [Bacteroidales bacterium]|nr:SprT-like domain-containing protein [Bacteroidales bacterium]